MSDDREKAAEMPVGAVDASGEPMDVGVTPPEQPPMIDADGEGEVNGEDRPDGPDQPSDAALQVQGGE